MKTHLSGYVAVAACMAAIAVLGGVPGAVVCLIAIVPSLVVMSPWPRDPEVPTPIGTEYRRWLACTGLFSLFVACLIPFTSHPAVTLALMLLSPLFGTSVYLVATVLFKRSSG